MFDGCIMKWNRGNQFWTYIFLILPNSIQRNFFIVLENDIMQRTLKNIYYLSRIWVKKSTIQKKINWFIRIPKITEFHAFIPEIQQNMERYPNPDWTIYPPHFSILQAVNKIHCLYANAVVQPSVQYYSCYMAWKTKVHTWCRYSHFCINAPMWREKRWLQGIFDPPSYIMHYALCIILINRFGVMICRYCLLCCSIHML